MQSPYKVQVREFAFSIYQAQIGIESWFSAQLTCCTANYFYPFSDLVECKGEPDILQASLSQMLARACFEHALPVQAMMSWSGQAAKNPNLVMLEQHFGINTVTVP